ncbi:hypothetical protein DMC15_12905 [Vibrio sp. 11986-1-5]|nr:hypothetical protein DMC15_12905 [Vibrio sp. 11986-1-5]
MVVTQNGQVLRAWCFTVLALGYSFTLMVIKMSTFDETTAFYRYFLKQRHCIKSFLVLSMTAFSLT